MQILLDFLPILHSHGNQNCCLTSLICHFLLTSIQFFIIMSVKVMTSVIAGAGCKDRGPLRRGDTPPYLSLKKFMKELSIFIDESGDFGDYEHHCPYYIVMLVFHDQSIDISGDINHLNRKFRYAGFTDKPVHAGPIIRNEGIYRNMSLLERRSIFNSLYFFTKNVDISYKSLIVEKKQLDADLDLHRRINRQLSIFLKDNLNKFLSYERIAVYYDFGQMELTKILVSVFDTILGDVEFNKVVPADYKLFQVADMLCTLELSAIKAERNILSNSEMMFFKSPKNLYKSYLRATRRKRFD